MPRLVESEVSVTVTATHATEPGCRPTARALTDTVTVRLDSPSGSAPSSTGPSPSGSGSSRRPDRPSGPGNDETAPAP